MKEDSVRNFLSVKPTLQNINLVDLFKEEVHSDRIQICAAKHILVWTCNVCMPAILMSPCLKIY